MNLIQTQYTTLSEYSVSMADVNVWKYPTRTEAMTNKKFLKIYSNVCLR